MERTTVASSNVISIGYHKSTRVMEVEFKGGAVYQYGGVTAEDHAMLMAAPSVGGCLAKNIKGKYAAERIK